jgi:hypothetical protein
MNASATSCCHCVFTGIVTRACKQSLIIAAWDYDEIFAVSVNDLWFPDMTVPSFVEKSLTMHPAGAVGAPAPVCLRDA